MDVYMYQAALWCSDCGEKIKEDLTAEGKAPESPDDEMTFDSDDFPKGPYDASGGEADNPQHCDGCGMFLENDLTGDGRNGLCKMIARKLGEKGKVSEAMREWVEFYDVSVKDLLDWSEVG